MVARRRYERVAKGITVRNDQTTRRILITFDDETFTQISDLAEYHQTSFAEIVRQLVETALEDESVYD